MIETLLGTLVIKAGGQLLKAALEGRDINGSDASAGVSLLLDAMVKGANKTSETLGRIEEKVDALAQQRYFAAMVAGRRLLQDASPEWRSPADRAQMLADARNEFARAIGSTESIREQAAAEVLYGLTWLASGSPRDTLASLQRAATNLEDEMLRRYMGAAADSLAYAAHQVRRQTPAEQIREAILGDRMPATSIAKSGSNFDLLWVLVDDHTALQHLRNAGAGSPHAFTVLPRPRGTEYDKPDPAFPVPLVDGVVSTAFGVSVRVSLSAGKIDLTNLRHGAVTYDIATDAADPPAGSLGALLMQLHQRAGAAPPALRRGSRELSPGDSTQQVIAVGNARSEVSVRAQIAGLGVARYSLQLSS